MLVKYNILSGASGSVGGLTASRNRGGQYFRSRVVPVNPSSPAQVTVRSNLSSLIAAWTNELTPTQRDAWDAYANANPVTNPLGDSRNAGGVAMFVRLNADRLLGGVARVDDPPSENGPALLSEVEFDDLTAGSTSSAVNFSNTDDWATADGGVLLLFASRPVPPTINSFKGPFRFMAAVLGDTSTPPTSPASVTLPFAPAAGQKIFLRAIASQVDGRLSGERITFLVAS